MCVSGCISSPRDTHAHGHGDPQSRDAFDSTRTARSHPPQGLATRMRKLMRQCYLLGYLPQLLCSSRRMGSWMSHSREKSAEAVRECGRLGMLLQVLLSLVSAAFS